MTTPSYPTRETPSPSSGRPSASLHFAVGEISGKLDQLGLTLIPQLKDHEERIGSLEVWQGRLIGGGAVIVFIITALEALPYAWHHFVQR